MAGNKVQVLSHEVSRVYGETRDKIQAVKRDTTRGGMTQQGLQATAYVSLHDGIEKLATGSGTLAPHEMAHVVQQSPGRLHTNQHDIHQQMMRPDQQKTRADANLLVEGGVPAQPPVVNYRVPASADEYAAGYSDRGHAESAYSDRVYSDPGEP